MMALVGGRRQWAVSGGGWKTAPLEGEGAGQCSCTLKWCRVEDARELENGTKKGRCWVHSGTAQDGRRQTAVVDGIGAVQRGAVRGWGVNDGHIWCHWMVKLEDEHGILGW